jgi:adenine-specific DNA-methyltransferase
MEISTGRVVPFRARQFLFNENDSIDDCAPLIWMNHIKNGRVEWPIENWRKEQLIIMNDHSLPILVPNGNYVLMRRFSPKEDIKRINTAPLYKTDYNFKYIGIENHVNYIHRPSGQLTDEEITGLSAILNSKYLDIYFRTLNGNTEVSATEMRDIPLPDYDFIIKVGRMIINKGLQNINIEELFLPEKSGAA